MILVLNCGSQSIKWKLFSDKLKKEKEGRIVVQDEKDYGSVLLQVLESLAEYKDKIKIIGHRIVHGGGKYKGPLVLNADILLALEKFSSLAPLHNPFNILGVKTAERVFPTAKNIAVFDTDFFTDLPEVAKTYALPSGIIEKFGFKKLGFQGISHEYVAQEAVKKLSAQGGPASGGKIITCHLGGGSSITAIKNGKPLDTSMGFTPMEGLVMMTRPGDIDPGIVLKLSEEFSVEKAGEILNKDSGVAGVCRSGQMLDVLKKIKRGDKSAKLALDIFVYSVKKYIGAYFAALGGCDALVFTGSIGSGSAKIRGMITKNIGILNKPGSPKGGTRVLAIKTDEELAIAKKIILSLRGTK